MKSLLITSASDGLICLDIPSYTLKKYCIYRIIFSQWTKWIQQRSRWIGYLDLTAGPGFSKVKSNSHSRKKQIAGSPFIALGTTPKFTHLFFNEGKKAYCHALRERLKRSGEHRFYEVSNEDANKYIIYALRRIEGHCLVCVDPFRPTDILWKTVERILKEDLCDIVGVYPAPLIQRSIGKFRGRLYVPGIHKHMPPDFRLDIETELMKSSAASCRKKIKEHFQRTTMHCFVREMPYAVLFSTKDHKLAKLIYNKLKKEGICDEIIFDE